MLSRVPEALLWLDREGRITKVNALATESLLRSAETLSGMAFVELLVPRYRRDVEQKLTRYIGSGVTSPLAILSDDLQGMRGDGSEFPVQLSIQALAGDAEGQFVVVMTDVTGRLLGYNRYKLSFEQSTEGMLIVSQDGLIVTANPALLQMFRYREDELIGMPVELLVPHQSQEAHRQQRADFLARPTQRRMGIGKELFGVRKDGELIPIEVGLAPFTGSRYTEVLVTVIDITERKKIEQERANLEAKIQQTQKLESLGLLSGGIAHDFNNILTGIVGNAELAMMELPPMSSARRYLQRMIDASYRAAELCEQMLAYSGGGKRIHEKFNLNDLIESTMDLIQVSVSQHASLGLHLSRDLPFVEGDVTQLRQVIMNLVINAAEAIAGKHGLITISTGVMDLFPAPANTPSLMEDFTPGKYVYLLVTDNGSGMSKDVQARIFDPFFTTKFTGRGLGLAAVLGIVRNHGGVVRVYSEEGIGTSFRILLPFDGTQDGFSEPAQDQRKDSGLVLIIDDESNVRQVVSDTLKLQGYTTLTASDGREGLELFKLYVHELKLVILDLTMPHMDGEETYRHLRQVDASVPVIITSGFSERDILSRFVGRGIAGFLQKPISPFKLRDLVQQALTAAQAK